MEALKRVTMPDATDEGLPGLPGQPSILHASLDGRQRSTSNPAQDEVCMSIDSSATLTLPSRQPLALLQLMCDAPSDTFLLMLLVNLHTPSYPLLEIFC